MAGNPYPNRYQNKQTVALTPQEFEEILLKSRDYDSDRFRRFAEAKYPWENFISSVKASALVSMLYYTGIRIGEICPSRDREYPVVGGFKVSKERSGLLKRSFVIEDDIIRITPPYVLKHGKRVGPIWIDRSNPGSEDIIDQVNSVVSDGVKLAQDMSVFPISYSTAHRMVKAVTGGRLYPHFFRLSRVTQFSKRDKVTGYSASILDLQQWFGFSSVETIKNYLGEAGEVTRAMAKRVT
jgi:hypothetical protein